VATSCSKRARSARVEKEVEVQRRVFEVAWLVGMLAVCLGGFGGDLVHARGRYCERLETPPPASPLLLINGQTHFRLW
jgi:hypothetical protein